MDEIALLKRKLSREKLARKAAESILEERALQLFESNEQLIKLNNELEIKVEERAKQLVKNEEKYRNIIENMELGLLEVDNNQTILRAYNWFCDMTGYSQEELLGKNAADVFLYNERHKKVVSQEQINREKGQAGIYEVQIKHKSGEPIWVMISGCPVYDINGVISGSLGIHYDITRQKKLQKALLEAKKAAEKSQKAEQLFLAKMSHEIRTPLNAIIGMSHLLNATGPNKEQQGYLKILGDSSNILKLLISDILDFSKIQAGELKVQKKKFDLTQLISQITNATNNQIEGKDVKITSNIDARIKNQVIGDELMLNQILINLLSNARKFTKKGEINTSVSIITERENHYDLEFKVTDTGIGISQEKKELIFQNFKQITNQDEKEINGTGLGLAITKQLVELQSGKINVSSIVNEGSTFSVSLTYEKGGQIISKPDEVINKQTENKFNRQKILVVEDNYMNRKYILTLLSKWNLDFKVAEDGIEAVAISREEKFDLIFMDISMPRLNGYGATEKIRSASNLNQDTPIVALSASAFVTKKERALEIGMTDFLCKPFDPQDLFQSISKYIDKKDPTDSSIQKEEDFTFPSPLNSKQLHSLYDANWMMAKEMFKIFLQNCYPEFKKFDLFLKEKDFISIKNLAHKLASNLAMVGLMQGNKHLLKLENMIEEKTNYDQIEDILNEVHSELTIAKPIIEECLIMFETNTKMTQTN